MVEQDAAPGGHAEDRAGWMARLEAVGIRLTRGAAGRGPLRRAVDGRVLGGVAAGIARRTGFDASLIRGVLVIAALVTSGLFAAFYVIGWLLIPAQGSSTSIGSRAAADKRGIGLAIAMASVVGVGLIVASALHAAWVTGLALPLLVCATGLVLIVRNAPESERRYLRDLADPVAPTAGGRRSRRGLRIGLSVLLLIAGLATLLAGHERTYQLLQPLTGVVLLLGGFGVALGPWWLRIARDRVAERQARIRAEERADMASRVHDSVLQTLALIQRQAADPHQVTQLARAQERELRSWLFDGRAPGSLDGQAATLADGIRLIQQDVEAQHGITVEAVTVGDCQLDEELTALLAAAREATVNAAKWSGAPVVSVFAEVEPESVAVFVRDRGRGFDPDAVPDDRKGLAESVRARLARRGGTATIRSAPGEGTEVSLVMPKMAADRARRRP
ncbi:MAG: PspC domain-containing protein [Actinobacteria bacterium]|nr:PspC domain-containing protein [Actinomycetota bacterium]